MFTIFMFIVLFKYRLIVSVLLYTGDIWYLHCFKSWGFTICGSIIPMALLIIATIYDVSSAFCSPSSKFRFRVSIFIFSFNMLFSEDLFIGIFLVILPKSIFSNCLLEYISFIFLLFSFIVNIFILFKKYICINILYFPLFFYCIS